MDISGTCAQEPNAESILDSLKLINDPSCGTNAAITDPGFESSLALIGAQFTAGRSLSRTIVDPSLAHTGNGALQLSVTQLCSSPRWDANIVVPATDGARGPVLTFFYRAPPTSNSYTFAVEAAAGSTFVLLLDDQYHQGKICLDPRLAGRNQVVSFQLAGGFGSCATTHLAVTAYVDDLEVATDPDCPTL